MSMPKPNEINQLIGQFLDLHEVWEDDHERFDWNKLSALAVAGATAYNEGNGPSFQILAIDGMHHDEFHARFLTASLEAGFDPFHLVPSSSGRGVATVFGHESLAEAAGKNTWSAQMLTAIQNLGRRRFDTEFDPSTYSAGELAQALQLFRDTLPTDVLEKRQSVAMA